MFAGADRMYVPMWHRGHSHHPSLGFGKPPCLRLKHQGPNQAILFPRHQPAWSLQSHLGSLFKYNIAFSGGRRDATMGRGFPWHPLRFPNRLPQHSDTKGGQTLSAANQDYSLARKIRDKQQRAAFPRSRVQVQRVQVQRLRTGPHAKDVWQGKTWLDRVAGNKNWHGGGGQYLRKDLGNVGTRNEIISPVEIGGRDVCGFMG